MNEVNKRVLLVVEDDAILAESIESVLTDLGYEVHTAVDGERGMQEALRLRPDAILADVALPLLNGLDLGQQIRAALPGVRLVAMSGYSGMQFKERALASGFDVYLSKPPILVVLEKALVPDQ